IGWACAWEVGSAAPAGIITGGSNAGARSRCRGRSWSVARRGGSFPGRRNSCSIRMRWPAPGGFAGRPIAPRRRVGASPEVPADAEIVIEGMIDTDLLEPEGPFGESHGHVALEDFNMSMQVTAITHKRSPVFVSIISQVTPSESSVIKKVAYEPLFLTHLR